MMQWLRANWFELFAIIGFAVFLAIIVYIGCSKEAMKGMIMRHSIDLMRTQTDMPRFSYRNTNLPDIDVIVDNETGIQYLCRSKYGITPLLSSDGKPKLVGEAGD